MRIILNCDIMPLFTPQAPYDYPRPVMINEPTLEDILADEATRLLMRRDQVSADDVRHLMADLSQALNRIQKPVS